jgi:hypothetical protein
MTASAAAAAAAFAAALAAREISVRALPIKLFFFAIVFPLIGQKSDLVRELVVTHGTDCQFATQFLFNRLTVVADLCDRGSYFFSRPAKLLRPVTRDHIV